MLYADYIRKKMHNLAKIITASGYPLKITSKFKQKAVDYKIYGKTEVGKNLIPYPYTNTTKTTNGITFTDNGDGSITVNGTATANAYFYLTSWKRFLLSNSIYTVTGCPSGGGANKYYISIRGVTDKGSTQTFFNRDFGTGVTIDLQDTTSDGIETTIEIKKGTVCDNLVFYPQLEVGTEATEYEPYTETGVGDKTKNLIPYPYYGFYGATTRTANGITYTDNGDGSITANGTADADSISVLTLAKSEQVLENGKTYTISDGVSNASYYTRVTIDSIDVFRSYKKPTYTTPENFTNGYIQLRIAKGAVVDNVTFYPMLELGETASSYEPYGYKIPIVNNVYGNEEETTVIYTNAQLKDGESISFKTDDLPQLQLYKGENNITVDTEVTPSEISVKYRD